MRANRWRLLTIAALAASILVAAVGSTRQRWAVLDTVVGLAVVAAAPLVAAGVRRFTRRDRRSLDEVIADVLAEVPGDDDLSDAAADRGCPPAARFSKDTVEQLVEQYPWQCPPGSLPRRTGGGA